MQDELQSAPAPGRRGFAAQLPSLPASAAAGQHPSARMQLSHRAEANAEAVELCSIFYRSAAYDPVVQCLILTAPPVKGVSFRSSCRRRLFRKSLPRTPQNAQLVCDINQERVLFQGSCYAILKQGPCAAGFVVAYRQNTNTVDCVKDVCGMGKVLWTDGKCYPEINQDHLCTGNLKLFKNKYNLGECGCAPGTVLWEPLNQCFPVFRRGPCEQGEILILNNSPEFEENQL
ncbi:unnamed protein product, partial [Cyprideis torosa]